jgi:hypothetical protein
MDAQLLASLTAACGVLQQSVEPLLDAYKPPGLVKKIYFKTLTFGDAPFKIDNVWVDKANPDEVCLEVLPVAALKLAVVASLRCDIL